MDPMTPDERRVVHNTLNGMEHIKTESSGEGSDRAVTIKYIA
jgi:spoIIIJ-associated protein